MVDGPIKTSVVNYLKNLDTVTIRIAEAMLNNSGDLVAVSRDPRIHMGIMELRQYVRSNPEVRIAYHQLLAESLQDAGLHTAERVLKLVELQKEAYGDQDNGIPSDPKMAIELSKEISRLIAESQITNVSSSTAILIASKEDAAGILKDFLGE